MIIFCRTGLGKLQPKLCSSKGCSGYHGHDVIAFVTEIHGISENITYETAKAPPQKRSNCPDLNKVEMMMSF